MTKIYRPDPDNLHYPLLWKHPAGFVELCGGLNFKSVKESWFAPDLYFYKEGKEEGLEPDMASLVPGIAVRRDLADVLFVEPNPHGTEWR